MLTTDYQQFTHIGTYEGTTPKTKQEGVTIGSKWWVIGGKKVKI